MSRKRHLNYFALVLNDKQKYASKNLTENETEENRPSRAKRGRNEDMASDDEQFCQMETQEDNQIGRRSM